MLFHNISGGKRDFELYAHKSSANKQPATRSAGQVGIRTRDPLSEIVR
jgi:hypothetical protein